MSSGHGDRLKLSHSLTTREKRQLLARLGEAMDARDAAQEALERVIATLYGRGISIATIQGATSIGQVTLKRYVEKHSGADAR